MVLKVTIEIQDDNKKSKIEIDEADSFNKVLIITKVFELFGVKTDVLNHVKTLEKINDAYSSFFSEVSPVEPISERIDEIKQNEQDDKNEIREKLITGYVEDEKTLENTYHEKNDYRVTGIKIMPDGSKKYALKYICTRCNMKSYHYVFETSRHVSCHGCLEQLVVLPAARKFLERDSQGVFFRAGKYIDEKQL